MKAISIEQIKNSIYGSNKSFRSEYFYISDKMTKEDFKYKFLITANYFVKKYNPNARFEIDKTNAESLKQIYLYMTGNKDFNGDLHKGLFLIGNFGVGKTTILKTLAAIFDIINKRKMIFLSSLQLHEIIKENGVEIIAKSPMIIDEIGRENEVVKDYGTEIRPIVELLTARYNNNAYTFATSNYNLDSLKKKYGQYITDRMVEMFNFIELTGETRRK